MKGKINAITNILFYIGLGLFFLFHIVPVLMNIFFSVIDYGKKIRFLGLQHYILLFKDKLFITAFSNNIIFFLLAIPLMILVAYPLARILSSCGFSFRWIKLPFLIPILVPSAAITHVWSILFGEENFIGKYIFHLSGWKAQWQDILPLLILFIWKNCGYHILIFMIGFMLIPSEIYEASAIDGASKRQQEFYITLPLMTGPFFISILFTFIQQLKIGREFLLLYGEVPKESLYLLPYYFREEFFNMNIGRMSSAAVIFPSPILLAFFTLYKFISRKEN